MREGHAIERADCITSPSVSVLEAVKGHYGFKLPASCMIPNPITPAESRGLWDIDRCDPQSLLFVGQFSSRKGGDYVLRAFARIVLSLPGVRLTFVGPDNGVKINGSVVHFWDFVRSNIPPEHRVRIEFCGPKSNSDIMSMRLRHSVTIVASQYEIAPYAILEAFSLGCPLVATAVGGIPEIVKDHENGLIVESHDVKAMAEACQRLTMDRDLARTLSRRAWKMCRDLYDPERIAKRTVAVYEEAVGRFKSKLSAGTWGSP